MANKRKALLQYGLAGAAIGYLVLHPMVMLASFLMTGREAAIHVTNATSSLDVLLGSFSLTMLPWSLSFALFNGIIGLHYGLRKAEKLAREELIANLQKALAEVKTLSGLLPICAWCKKIRSDEGYWQNIESYMKSHLDLDFTHAICQDCARKEYPDLYKDLDKNNGQ